MVSDVKISEDRKEMQKEQAKKLFDILRKYRKAKVEKAENEELHMMCQLLAIQSEEFIGMGRDILYWLMLNGETLGLGEEIKEITEQIERTKLLCETLKRSKVKEICQVASDMEKVCEILRYITEEKICEAIQFYEENREQFYAVFEGETE